MKLDKYFPEKNIKGLCIRVSETLHSKLLKTSKSKKVSLQKFVVALLMKGLEDLKK